MPSINCANCGAPLDAPSSARFISCRHCGTSLEIKRNDSAEWTETLGKVAAETERLREDVKALRVEQEVERLDREWEMRQRDLMERGKNGHAYRPTRGGGVAMAVAFAIFGIVAFCMSSIFSHAHGFVTQGSFGGPSGGSALPVLVFLLVVVGGVVAVVRTFAKAETYDSEEKSYRARREELLRRRDGD